MTRDEIRTATEREQELAEKMHDALVDLEKGYSDDEVLTALLALLCDEIRSDCDPRKLAQSVINALEANFFKH
jgi:hypothetical protein